MHCLVQKQLVGLGCLFWIWSSVIAVRGWAQDARVEEDPRFVAVAWVQNAAEYQVLALQTYRHATTQLQQGLLDRFWSADEVQLTTGGYQDKPPAVILDIDETVLDNSAFNARNVVDRLPYELERWNAWCHEARAVAVPGSLEFLKTARSLGVAVFFITNRRDEVKAATIRNLCALGIEADEHNVLTRNDEEDRGGDKLTRRAAVAKDYRIVLLIGDNLSDLGDDMEIAENQDRNRIARHKAELMGSRWIVMPNPVYGSWERALPSGPSALRLDR